MKNWTLKQPTEPGFYFAITASHKELNMVDVTRCGDELEAWPTGWDCSVGLEDYIVWSKRVPIPLLLEVREHIDMTDEEYLEFYKRATTESANG